MFQYGCVPESAIRGRFSDFAFKGWVDHRGRHKVYLDTTLRSPMPRSRTAAMLCGVIPVSLDNRDAVAFHSERRDMDFMRRRPRS